jgi:hypothetical protein
MAEPSIRSRIFALLLSSALLLVSGFLFEALHMENWMLRSFITIAVASIYPTLQIYESWQEHKRQQKEFESLVYRIWRFATSFIRSLAGTDAKRLAQKITRRIPDRAGRPPDDPFSVASAFFNEIGVADPESCKYLGILALCYIADQDRMGQGRMRSDYLQVVGRYVNGWHLTDTGGQESRRFLSLFHSVFVARRTVFAVSQIGAFMGGCTDGEISSAGREFLRRYLKSDVLDFFEKKLSKSEDLRITLASLFREGKIPTVGVWKEALAQIQRDLAENRVVGQYYLIIANETGRSEATTSLRDIAKRFLRIAGVGTATNLPNGDTQRFSLYLIRTRTSYPSVQDFIETEIEPNLEVGTPHTVLVSVYRLDPADSAIAVMPRETCLTNENLIKGRKILGLFSERMSDFDIMDVINSLELEVEQLLSVLPFNLLAQDITASERVFLVKNYDRVKTVFGCTKLTDWKNIDPSLLSNCLSQLEPPQYSHDELGTLFKIDSPDNLTPALIKTRYDLISQQIVDNAGKYHLALQGVI